MPVTVKVSKTKMSVICTIVSLLIAAIPLVLTIVTGNFLNYYSIFSMVVLGIIAYFSIIYGFVAWRDKGLYTALDVITLIACIASAGVGYYIQMPMLLHIGMTALITYGVYKTVDSKSGPIWARLAAPIIVTILGTATVLWLVGVGLDYTWHVVIASIINIPVLIYDITSHVKFHKKNLIENVLDSHYVIQKPTKEEIIFAENERKERERKIKELEQKKLEEEFEKMYNERYKNPNNMADYIIEKTYEIQEGEEYVFSPQTLNALRDRMERFYESFLNLAGYPVELARQSWKKAMKNGSDVAAEIELTAYDGLHRGFIHDKNETTRAYNRIMDVYNKMVKQVFTANDMGKTYRYSLSLGKVEKSKFGNPKLVHLSFSGTKHEFTIGDTSTRHYVECYILPSYFELVNRKNI